MDEFPKQKITIYHKTESRYNRFVIDASFRQTSILNHNRNGSNSVDTVLIRTFDVKGYNSKWFVAKGDIIVDMEVSDDIEGTTPYTQLLKKYGEDNVFKVTSIDKFIFKDEDLIELNHIKIGAK